jgi:hypothetical protein
LLLLLLPDGLLLLMMEHGKKRSQSSVCKTTFGIHHKNILMYTDFSRKNA